MKENEECLHCLLNSTMDAYHERVHMSSGRQANVDVTIDHLMACAAELIAMYGDAKTRKFVAKREAEKLVRYVRQFREEGRYPGGFGARSH